MSADPAEQREIESPSPLDTFRSAVAELTVFCSTHRKPVIDSSALFYPPIGLALGGVSLAIDQLGRPLGQVGASTAVVLVATAITGGRPVFGLARSLVAVWTARADRALDRLSAAPTMAVWVVAALVLGAEITCLSELVSWRPVGLLFAPLLGRWSMVVLAVGARAARADGRRVKFAPGVTFREFGWASTVTFAIVFGVAEFVGVLLGAAAAALSVGTRVALHRWLDGVTEAMLDALCALVELGTIVLLVVMR